MSYVLLALTFDGGPDGLPADPARLAKKFNTTEHLLATLRDPRIPGAGNLKAAFFVQTHAPGRMADAAGQLGATPAQWTHGQRLVHAMAAEGHVIGVLNGARDEFQRHDNAQGGAAPGLVANLHAAVNALTAVLPPEQPVVRFVRSPFGVKNAAVDAAYAAFVPPLEHCFWEELGSKPIPAGDLCPGVPLEPTDARDKKGDKGKAEWQQNQFIALGVRAASTVRRQLLDHAAAGGAGPLPDPVPVVLRFHDIVPVTVANLPKVLSWILDGIRSVTPRGKPNIPARFCATRAEVEWSLRTLALRGKGTDFKRAASDQYDPKPRLAKTYGPLDVTQQCLALIHHEGWVNHLYLDDGGNMTVGVGLRVFQAGTGAQLVETLHLLDSTGHEPTDAELPPAGDGRSGKSVSFESLVKKKKAVLAGPPAGLKMRAWKWMDPKLHLTEPETERLLLQKRGEFYHGPTPTAPRGLQDVLDDFGVGPLTDVPTSVIHVFFDLAYNAGHGQLARGGKPGTGLRAFKAFFNSIKIRRWDLAAKEVRRGQDQKNGSIRRRDDANAEALRAIASLEGEPPLVTISPAPAVVIDHSVAERPAYAPLAVEVALAAGWTRTGPASWSARIEYTERGRNDVTELSGGPLVLDTSGRGVIALGTPVLGGVLRVKISVEARFGAATPQRLPSERLGAITGRNPAPNSVRTALDTLGTELRVEFPALSTHALRAIAFHTTTRGGGSPAATAYRPFDTEGQPLRLRTLAGAELSSYGLLHLPLVAATREELWQWPVQADTAKRRLAVCAARAVSDQKGAPRALTGEEFLQQVVHYYTQTADLRQAQPYWKLRKRIWEPVGRPLGTFADAVAGLVRLVEAQTPPAGW